MARSPRLIDELEHAVCETTSEKKLHEALDRGLGALRHQYRRDPTHFGDRDLARLRQLRQILDRVGRSMELLEMATYAQDTAEYESLQRELMDLAEKLDTLPVGETVRREIQRLPKRPPAIQAQEKQQEKAQKTRIANELEAGAERCPEGHMMKIRRGSRGPFWGCSEYPKCRATRDLKPEEMTLLNSILYGGRTSAHP